jgi:hypothetical protein
VKFIQLECMYIFSGLILLSFSLACEVLSNQEHEFIFIRTIGNGSSIPGTNPYEHKYCLNNHSKLEDVDIDSDLTHPNEKDNVHSYEDIGEANIFVRDKIHKRFPVHHL